MPTIAIANQAGSAGKTTTAVNIAALCAAELGLRVRLIDSDGQANATAALGVVVGDSPTLGDVLLEQATVDQAEQTTKVDGLTLLPSTFDLDEAAVQLGRSLGGEQRLRRALQPAPPVDLTIIDCPGALSVLTVAALIVADSVVTVTKPALKEMGGIPAMEETIESVRQNYSEVTLAAIVPCEVPPPAAGKVYVMALDLLAAEYEDMVTPPVRRSARVPESYSHGLPLNLHAPTAPVTDDYRQVVEYLRARGTFG